MLVPESFYLDRERIEHILQTREPPEHLVEGGQIDLVFPIPFQLTAEYFFEIKNRTTRRRLENGELVIPGMEVDDNGYVRQRGIIDGRLVLGSQDFAWPSDVGGKYNFPRLQKFIHFCGRELDGALVYVKGAYVPLATQREVNKGETYTIQ